MLAVSLRRQHLIKRIGRLVDDPLLGSQYLHPPVQRRAHPHHVSRHLKHNRSLLPVSCTAVHLRTLLPVPAGQKQRHRRRKLTLSLLLRYLDISRVELPVPVPLHRPEHIPDDLLLPVDQLKRLPRPGPLRMAQTLNEADRIIRGRLIIDRPSRPELRWLIFLQLPHRHQPHLLPSAHPHLHFSHCRYTCSEIFAIITGGTLMPQTYCTFWSMKS